MVFQFSASVPNFQSAFASLKSAFDIIQAALQALIPPVGAGITHFSYTINPGRSGCLLLWTVLEEKDFHSSCVCVGVALIDIYALLYLYLGLWVPRTET